MRFIEDRAPFFADFGEAATLNGNGVTVIFDHDFLASLGVESSSPVAVIDDVQAVGLTHGLNLVLRGITYALVGIHPDGTGLTHLELEKI